MSWASKLRPETRRTLNTRKNSGSTALYPTSCVSGPWSICARVTVPRSTMGRCLTRATACTSGSAATRVNRRSKRTLPAGRSYTSDGRLTRNVRIPLGSIPSGRSSSRSKLRSIRPAAVSITRTSATCPAISVRQGPTACRRALQLTGSACNVGRTSGREARSAGTRPNRMVVRPASASANRLTGHVTANASRSSSRV